MFIQGIIENGPQLEENTGLKKKFKMGDNRACLHAEVNDPKGQEQLKRQESVSKRTKYLRKSSSGAIGL